MEAPNTSNELTSALSENPIHTPPNNTDPDTNTSEMAQPASAPDNTEAETFTPFPKLPIELRLKIWNHALPCGHRLVIVNQAPDPENVSSGDIAMMRVNREARELASKKYRVAFQPHFKRTPPFPPRSARPDEHT